MEAKLLETVADIAYNAGQNEYYSGNSREYISNFIWWAMEFEKFHKNTDWDRTDYMLTIEAYTNDKIADAIKEANND